MRNIVIITNQEEKPKRKRTMKKLEYVDLKNAIDSIEQTISDGEAALQINYIVLKTFKEEIKKLPKPKIADEKHQEPFTS